MHQHASPAARTRWCARSAWINNCVGLGNHRYFLLFLACNLFMTVYATAVAVLALLSHADQAGMLSHKVGRGGRGTIAQSCGCFASKKGLAAREEDQAAATAGPVATRVRAPAPPLAVL